MTATYTVPKTIASSNQDVTEKLSDWLVKIPNGTASHPIDISLNRRSFRCEGTLENTLKKYWRIRDGALWNTESGDGHRAFWRFIDSTAINFLNVRLTGPRKKFSPYDSDKEWQHGFDFQGVTSYDIAACIVSGVYGDMICNGRSPKGTWTSEGNIRATCKSLGTGRQVISFTAAKDIKVYGMHIEDPTLSIFDIEPNGQGWGAQNILIDGPTISDTNPEHTFSLLYAADYVSGGSVSNITVKNTSQTGNGIVIVAKATSPNRYKSITVIGNKTDTPNRGYADLERIDQLVFNTNMINSDQIKIVDCT